MPRAVPAVALAIALAGCSLPPSIFQCAADEQCVGTGGGAGVCEPTGYCSFADSACAADRRYGDLAPAGIAGQCVGDEMLPDDIDAAVPPGVADAQAAIDASPPPDAPLPDADTGEVVLVLGAAVATDSEIDDSAPSDNRGGATLMRVDGMPLRRGLIRFDVTSVPAGAVILAASLRVVTTNDDPLPSGTVRVHRLLESWDEASVTWNERSPGVAWTTAGAGAPGSHDPVVLAEFEPDEETEPYVVSLPVGVISGWVVDPASNAGLLLVAWMTGDQSAYFYSSEAGMPPRRPSLSITYMLP